MKRNQLKKKFEAALSGEDSEKEIQRLMVGRKRASEMFDVARGTLANKLSKGEGPKAYRCGSKILYKISDLEEYFYSNPIQTLDSLKN